jgi:hypothetical protein
VQTTSDLLEQLVASVLASSTLLQDDQAVPDLSTTAKNLTSCPRANGTEHVPASARIEGTNSARLFTPGERNTLAKY